EELVVAHNNFVISNANTSLNLKTINQDTNVYTNEITIKDYENLSAKETILYDKRPFFKYIKDELIRSHKLVGIMFKRSLLTPHYITISKLVFELSLQFALNAILFSDYYIDERVNQPLRVILYNI